jgi:large subunit ribosomal protein L4
MPQLDVLDIKKKKVGVVEAVASIFDVKIKKHLVKQYAVLQQATRRRGTACTKSSYSELSGSGKKPWRQKGTGRARAGEVRSAVWRGGLTIFGPTPRDYGFKMNKKAKKQALKSVLTQRLQGNNIAVVDKLELENPKTKEAVQLLKSLELSGRTLFLIAARNANLELAVRNLPGANVLPVEGLNVLDLLLYEKIVCTPETFKKLEERLG